MLLGAGFGVYFMLLRLTCGAGELFLDASSQQHAGERLGVSPTSDAMFHPKRHNPVVLTSQLKKL